MDLEEWAMKTARLMGYEVKKFIISPSYSWSVIFAPDGDTVLAMTTSDLKNGDSTSLSHPNVVKDLRERYGITWQPK
jgi:hypothetical protein